MATENKNIENIVGNEKIEKIEETLGKYAYWIGNQPYENKVYDSCSHCSGDGD